MTVFEIAEILTRFYGECYRFWIREGKDEVSARQLAMKDIEGITTNPYSPNGEKFNTDDKEMVVKILSELI